ncbi:hypothetical protein V498_02383 [Pseudogymnoascus sp. VKM F-4517 (FW-2822)]|nr:hypothetical protein V498_02383 [Pseudogymnoascus sp. VKM F-4517 (FW-2822)]
MPAPAPPGALTSAFRTESSAKCTYCVAQKGKCVAFLADEYKDLASEEASADEYKDLASEEASSNPDPAVINAAAKEIERVAQVAGKNFPKFKTPYERASYMEHLVLRRSLEEATTRARKSAHAAHQDSLAVQAKLDALLAAANKLGEAVDKGVGSVAAAVAGGEPRGKKRKRKEGEGEEESSEEEVGREDFGA